MTAASLEAGFKEGLGALSSSVQVGARLVSKGGTATGIVLDMQLPGAAFASMPSFLESAAQSTAATSGGRITKRTKVRGHPVIVASGGTASFAAYQHGEGLVYAFASTAKEALAMLTSLIKATEGGGKGAATAEPSAAGASGGLPLSAGTYSTLAFQPTVTYTVPDGWERSVDHASMHQLRPSGSDVATVNLFSKPAAAVQDDACTAAADPAVGSTSADLVKWIGDRPGLAVSTPTMVTVGGLPGQMVDIRIKDGWNQSCPFANGQPTVPLFNGGSAGYNWVIFGDERMRLYLLDLPGGGTLGVGVDSVDPSVMDQLVSQATPIIKSLQVKTGL